MNQLKDEKRLEEFAGTFEGEFYFNDIYRNLYATDASAYREKPLAVAIPENPEAIQKVIKLARELKTSIIPRTAGTSLAGQVVGNGIVLDLSKYLNKILEVNKEGKWVRVEPGIVRDDLNLALRNYGLFFAPETATANRAMIGGMAGNNSCGSNSIVYGSTRDHLLSVKMILADGNEVIFGPLNNSEYAMKVNGKNCSSSIEKKIYQTIDRILKDKGNQENIIREYPKPDIKRRNTGYAIDLLMQTAPFGDYRDPFNMCRLIAGSEGTLGIITELKLHLEPLPSEHKGLVCIHFNSLYESLEANLVALKYQPTASELIDHYILDCTKENIGQRKNRFFIQGEPQAILIVEITRDSEKQLEESLKHLISDLKSSKYGYHYPVLYGDDMSRIWSLRKAGLGLLSNIPGDAKPVPVIEDTAVDVNDLPAYIKEFNETLKKYDLYCVHYAHAGSGELHLRPIINLKTSEGQQLYRSVLEEVAKLVKKYHGSLSGEHGDGRLRGEFIPFMIGEKNYALLEEIKRIWDPDFIFNPGKIVKTPPMNTYLRYQPDQETRSLDTWFDFSRTQGILRATEQCNGSGDCRKTVLSGGTMCPSYMATKNEKDTTRARANILREMLTNSSKSNPFDHKEIYEVLDLCLSCKGCKSECPSNVDMARLKAEFLQHYLDANGVPIRTWLISHITGINRLGSFFPNFFNLMISSQFPGQTIKARIGFSKKRTIPALHSYTFRNWLKKQRSHTKLPPGNKKSLLLYIDEFTNYNDVSIGIAAYELLISLGYHIYIPRLHESGRTFLSKGMVKKAKKLASFNVRTVSEQLQESDSLVGIEPSAILSFRDEYPDLVDPSLKQASIRISERTLTFEEFISGEFDKGNIDPDLFTDDHAEILIHNHCHQKALSSQVHTQRILMLPRNYKARIIPSGCCGMAGSFGFEKEHYDVSMQIGELVLFPSIRNSDTSVILSASGTSCRHQILDGTGRRALHPAEILRNALKK